MHRMFIMSCCFHYQLLPGLKVQRIKASVRTEKLLYFKNNVVILQENSLT